MIFSCRKQGNVSSFECYNCFDENMKHEFITRPLCRRMNEVTEAVINTKPIRERVREAHFSPIIIATRERKPIRKRKLVRERS